MDTLFKVCGQHELVQMQGGREICRDPRTFEMLVPASSPEEAIEKAIRFHKKIENKFSSLVPIRSECWSVHSASIIGNPTNGFTALVEGLPVEFIPKPAESTT